MNSPTKEQMVAGFKVMAAVCETIREAKRIPSGTLYATLIGRMDLEAYNKMVGMLKNTGLVTEVAHELVWTGPVI